MIGVRLVVVRRKNSAEASASCVFRFLQELRLFVLTRPVGKDTYARPVSEDESGDIDGVAGSVFTPGPFITSV